MQINLDPGAQPLPENSRTDGQTASDTTAASSSATNFSAANLGEDQALFSGAHAQVQALAAQAIQLPEIRQERVQSLRQAVQSGNYHPSPEDVAGALFSGLIAEQAA